jgi:hypothetical protein
VIEPNSRRYVRDRDPFSMLCRRVEPYQGRLATHAIYTRVRDERGLRIFMANHVFAVWDFMSLTKTLQQKLTCLTVPWVPVASARAARLINEIVLGEESDDLGDEEYLSHYVLYMRAMDEIGADKTAITTFEASLRAGVDPLDALAPLPCEPATKEFVKHTLALTKRPAHEVAAGLLLAREDLIPLMFDRLVREMDSRTGLAARGARAVRSVRERLPEWARDGAPQGLREAAARIDADHPDPRAFFRKYLERHVHLDGEEHGPMAQRLLEELCGDDTAAWDQATDAARAALEARVRLWDGVLRAIERGPG